MGSIIGHRIDYNRVEGYEGLVAHTQQKLTQVTPPPGFGFSSTFAIAF